MKKTIVALAVMGIGFGAGAAHAQDMVVKLGNVAPLTGTISHLGKDLENGTRLAIEEANAKGVSIGGKKVKFELLGEDDQADPRTGTTVAQRLVDAGVKGVIGHLNSGTSIPASRIYDQAGIPQVSPASTGSSFASLARATFLWMTSSFSGGGSKRTLEGEAQAMGTRAAVRAALEWLAATPGGRALGYDPIAAHLASQFVLKLVPARDGVTVPSSTVAFPMPPRLALEAVRGTLPERAAVRLLAHEGDRPGLEVARDPLEALRRTAEVAAAQVA